MQKLTLAEKKYLIKNDFIIKSNFAGLTKLEISILKKTMPNKKVQIREGLPFSPAFLISFILYVIFYFLWN